MDQLVCDWVSSHPGKKYQRPLIFISITTSVVVSIKYNAPLLMDSYIAYCGLIIIFIGIILRYLIITTLGQLFTADVTIKQNHRLNKDGFFKHVRHPSYSASLLSFINFGISLNNIISVMLVSILIFTAFIIRIRVEERVLIEHFGSEYLDYKKATKRIIPFIY